MCYSLRLLLCFEPKQVSREVARARDVPDLGLVVPSIPENEIEGVEIFGTETPAVVPVAVVVAVHDEADAEAEEDSVEPLELQPLGDPAPGDGAKHKGLQGSCAAIHGELLSSAPLLADDRAPDGKEAQGEPLLPQAFPANDRSAQPSKAAC